MNSNCVKLLCILFLLAVSGLMAGLIVIGATYPQIWVGIVVTQLVTMCALIFLVILDYLLIKLFVSGDDTADDGAERGKQQSLFPLIGDSFRGNARSSPLFMVLYMLLFSLILLLIILSFTKNKSQGPTLTYAAKPSAFVIGSVHSPITVAITSDNSPLRNERVRLTIFPVDPIVLSPTLGSQTSVSRHINCLRSALGVQSGLFDNDDAYFCGPWVFETSTDVHGMASFDAVIITSGASVSYAFIAYVASRPAASVMEIATASLAVTKIYLSSPTPLGAASMTVGTPLTFEVTATVVSQIEPVLLTAAVMPVFVNPQDPGQSWMPFGAADGFTAKAAVIENARAVSTRIDKIAATGIASSIGSTYNVTFLFSNLKIMGASSYFTTFAVAVSSTLLPISSVDFSVLGSTSPNNLIFPFFPSGSNPSFDQATIISSDLAGGRITEGTFFSLVVQMSGVSTIDRYGFLMLEPAIGDGSSTSLNAEHPSTSAKELGNQAVRIPAGESTVAFSSVFSIAGAVGQYKLHFLVNVVSALWFNASIGEVFLVAVESSIASVLVSYSAALVDEEVGTNWAVLPVVTIRDANGNPVIGKIPVLVPVDPSGTTVGINSFALKSGNDGVAYFLTLRVGFANSVPALGTTLLSFHLLADGKVWAVLKRRFSQPVSAAAASCSYIRFKPLPPTLRGVSSFTLETLDTFGRPVGGASVTLEATDGSSSPISLAVSAAGVYYDQSISAVTTNSSGLATLYLTSPSPGVSGVTVGARCQGDPEGSTTHANLVFAMSVFFAEVADSSNYSDPSIVTVTNLLVDWATISSTSPVALTAQVVFGPAYVEQFQGARAIPTYSTAIVSSKTDLPLNLTVVSPASIPNGFYAYVILVDGVRAGLGFFNLVNYLRMLSLVTSGFPPDFTFGLVNTLQPVVKVELDGSPVANIVVYAEILYCDADCQVLESGAVQDVKLDPLSIVSGISFLNHPSGLDYPTATTDALGIATFTDLLIANVPSNMNISLRYCIMSNFVAGYSQCVRDSGFAVYAGSSVTLNASSASLVGTPGAIVDNHIIITGLVDGSPVSLMQCTAVATYSNSSLILDNFLSFYDPDSEHDIQLASSVFTTVGSSQKFKLGIGSTALEGLYDVTFLCAGGSLILSVAVTRMPFAITYSDLPDPSITVNNMDTINVQVRSAGGGPLPNAVVTIRVRLPCGINSCEDSLIPCGIISGKTVAKTDFSGTAALSYFFDRAPSGVYILEAAVLRPADAAYQANSLSSGIEDIEGLIGTSAINLKGSVALTTDQLALLYAATTSNAHPSQPSRADSCFAGSTAASSSSGQLFAEFASYASVDVARQIVSSQFPIDVTNHVASIEVQLPAPLTLQLPQVVQGFAARGATLSVPRNLAPVLLMLDKSGNPVANASVEVAWLSATSANATVYYPPSLTTDASGYCTVFPLVLSAESSGAYRLVFSSKGGGASSVVINVLPATVLSRDQAMKLAAYTLFGLCSPLFLLLVPHSRIISFAFASIVVVVVAVVVYYYGGIKDVLASVGVEMNEYVLGYFNLVIALLATVIAGFVLLLVVKLLSVLDRSGRFKLADDELIGRRRFAYVQWLVNVRLAKQPPPAESFSAQLRKSGRCSSSSLKTAGHRPTEMNVVPPTNPSSQHNADGTDFDPCCQPAHINAPSSARQLIGQVFAPPQRDHSSDGVIATASSEPSVRLPVALEYDSSVDPSTIPVTVWAAVGVGAILCAGSILILLYVRDDAIAKLKLLSQYFPSTAAFDDLERIVLTPSDLQLGSISSIISSLPIDVQQNVTDHLNAGLQHAERQLNSGIGASPANGLARVNAIVVAVLTQLLGFLAKKFPQLGSLASLLTQLQSINLVDVLGQINALLLSIIESFNTAFVVAMVVSLVILSLNFIAVLFNVRKLSGEIRRGMYHFEKAPSAIVVSPYVPCHAFHFFVMHQALFWILFIIVFVLSWAAVRNILYTLLLQVVLPAVISGPLMKIIQNIILRHYFLASDDLTVVRPELFSFWVLYSLATSTIAAIGLTIARFFTYIIAGVVVFARLDFSIYPRPLAFLDNPHAQFISTVAMEVRASNPIATLFTAMLICGCRARERVRRGTDADCYPVPFNQLVSGDSVGVRECSCRNTTSGAVINAAANYGEMMAARGVKSAAPLEKSPRCWKTSDYYGPDVNAWIRRNRVANRFWLAFVLTNNPSLRQLRKSSANTSGATTSQV